MLFPLICFKKMIIFCSFQQAQQIDEALLHFPEQLQHIGIAAR